MSPREFLEALRQDPLLGPKLAHMEWIEPRGGSYLEPETPLPGVIAQRLKQLGIPKLYSHQALALDALDRGEHVTVVTPTASGKSLTFILPVLKNLLKDPQAKALFLFPIKALAQDQLGNISDWLTCLGQDAPKAAIYDGDTSAHFRAKLRGQPPAVLITNPDMLHLGLLPYHSGWAGFFKNLKLVVIDEAHSYRGIFGAHGAWVLRRLRRVAALYGAHPQFIMLSATVANPGEFSQRLLGMPTTVVDQNGAPAAGRHFGLWQSEDSVYRDATELFGRLVNAGFKTIAFTKARKITELMARWAWEAWPDLKERTRAYRAGYLPEERRQIEQRLFAGELDGVIATSALELGIDVGGLDACILVGYPGTMISTWQRAGRVGRGGRESLVFLLPLQDAIDQYYVQHPEFFFTKPFEQALVPVQNKVIRAGHLAAAAEELPIQARMAQEEALLGPGLAQACEELWRQGLLGQSQQGVYHPQARQAARRVSLRGAGDSFAIEALAKAGAKNRIIGSIEPPKVFRDCHPGAIYLHAGQQYRVRELDMAGHRVGVEEVEADYYTEPRGRDEIEILTVDEALSLGQGLRWCRGKVRATERVTGYVVKHLQTRAVMSEHSLEMPAHVYETEAAWWELPPEWRAELAALGHDFSGAIHALEHSQIALLPLMVLCDRWDLGGVSYWSQPQLNLPAVFVYDGHAGGADLSARGYALVKDWLAAVEVMLKDCPCAEGCPSCIQSPKCGNGNKPLDKAGALELTRRLRALLEKGGEVNRADDAAPAPAKPILPDPRPLPTAVAPLPANAAQPAPASALARPKKVVVFDLETQFLAQEVGGWGNTAAMKVSVGVAWLEQEQRYLQVTEANIQALVDALRGADLVVGFNNKGFDNGVLQPYAPGLDLASLPTLDLLEQVRAALGFRLGLDALAKATLGAQKGADGLQAVAWWRAGDLLPLLQYCQQDVALTRDLWRFGKEHGYLLYEDKQGQLMKVAVKW
jgi:DEAD/DEAH box helicase domain-containing protein